jgi:hypothetical protein
MGEQSTTRDRDSARGTAGAVNKGSFFFALDAACMYVSHLLSFLCAMTQVLLVVCPIVLHIQQGYYLPIGR